MEGIGAQSAKRENDKVILLAEKPSLRSVVKSLNETEDKKENSDENREKT